jgi:bifunctional ADP-heptose synthase (sugar kinase/adenylyltransferase)
VTKQGGQVVIIPFLEGFSTTAIIDRIQTNRGVAATK